MHRALRPIAIVFAVVLIAWTWGRPAVATTAVLGAAKDNSLYEVAEEDPALSNGSGQFIFAGRTATGTMRRALLAFDLGGIPPGSTITSASLGLTLSMSISAEQPLSLHRLNASWGEGTSDATGPEGQGAPASLGDATWFHRFYAATPWVTPGGDFESAPSATAAVTDDFIRWTWSSVAMAADLQDWLDAPSTNRGWILLGNEIDSATAKRFGSRTNPTPAQRPVLTVVFTPPSGEGAGAVAQTGAAALRIARATGADLTLTWGGASCAADPDFEIYEGTLGSPASAFPVVCTTSETTSATITPGAGDRFYLAVPRAALLEGSYGTTTGSIQRPPSTSACLPQSILSCR